MAVDLQLAGADDVISEHLNIPLYGLVWVLRVGFFVAPAVAFLLARRACLALQRRDRRVLSTGIARGVVTPGLDGGYHEEVRPLNEEEQAQLPTRRPAELTASIPRHIVPLPTPRRFRAQVISRANRFYTSYRVEVPSSYGQPDGQRSAGRENGAQPDGAQPDGQPDSADSGG
jgi:ubiquinol-cytochrome c reductase cytochrome b subunit